MKLVQFCQLYPPAVYGGGEYLFFNYARELVKHGWQVDVVTQRLKDTSSYEEIDGIRIHRIGKPVDYKGHLNMSFKENLSFIINAFKKGMQVCKGADIIHSNTYAPAVSGNAVSFLLKIPHVISIFDVYSKGSFWKEWSNQEGVSKGLNILGGILEKIILKFRPALIHTISDASVQDLMHAKVRSPIKMVPCMIDLNEYKIKPVKPKNQFVYVGRHVFYKNVNTVIKAMPEILKTNPKTKFIIIGDGPMRASWEELSKQLGVNDNVIFTGRVSQELKLKIMNESKFLVHPSIVEGFGIVLLEAWALGKAVLASNVPPLNELVNKYNGEVIEPFNEKAWSQAINKELKKKRTNIKASAEKYSNTNVTKLLIKMLENVKK